MIGWKPTILIAATGLILAGCSGGELQRAEGLNAGGSEFSKNLYSGYIELSKLEAGEQDFKDSDTFAMRASSAAGGKPGEPENIANRKLPKNKVGELSDARARLMAALAAGARDKAPVAAANAQVDFDCWMQEAGRELPTRPHRDLPLRFHEGLWRRPRRRSSRRRWPRRPRRWPRRQWRWHPRR